jgi:hypothetical protein
LIASVTRGFTTLESVMLVIGHELALTPSFE